MSFPQTYRTVQTADGRDLEVVIAGPEEGPVYLFHSGTPSAAVLYGPSVEAAAARGLRTINFSRPGYSESSSQRGRSVGDVAADVAAILDALGVSTFVCAGQSGGGPHAIACASLLPDRCLAAASISGVAPYAADGLDWMAGMGPENVEEFGCALEGEAALTTYLHAAAEALADVRADQVAAALGGLLSDVDARALTGEFAEFLAVSFHRAVSAGIAGWRDDDLAFATPWGFDLATIRTPVAVWQGGEDRMVPPAHGAWLAAHIPNSEAHLHPAEGHLSLALTSMGPIVDGLLAMAGPDFAPIPSASNPV